MNLWKSIKQLMWEFKEFMTEDDQTLSRIKNLRRQGVPEDNPMSEHLKKQWIREQKDD